jgi:acetylornithine deacetylase
MESLIDAIDRGRLERQLINVINRYSPSYAEAPALLAYEEALNAAGVGYRRQPVASSEEGGERWNLIIELGPQEPGPELLWVGHVDTVEWHEERPPRARISGDTLHGLGSADMKGGCSAIVEAVIALAGSGVEWQRGLCVALVVGEEGYGDGSAELLKEISAPLTVIGEPTALASCIDHYGYYEYRLQCSGARVHAALPEIGGNAIHAMLAWLLAVMEQAPAIDPQRRIAVNPRHIQGGAELFVVAEACETLLDVHLPAGFDLTASDRLLEQTRAGVAESHPQCQLAFERLYSADGYSLEESDPRLAPLRRACSRAGVAWEPATFRSHSDGNLFHLQGGFPVICGPGRLEVAHTRDEQVSLDQVVAAARLYLCLIEEVCLQ